MRGKSRPQKGTYDAVATAANAPMRGACFDFHTP